MIKNISLVILFCSICWISTSAQNAKRTLPSGIKLHLFKHNPNARKGKVGEFLTFHFKMTMADGKVLGNSFTQGKPIENIPIVAPQFKGDINEAFAILAEGDSSKIDVPIDTVKKYSKARMPPTNKPGAYISYIIKVLKIRNQTERLQYDQRKTAALRAKEKVVIDKYLADKKLTDQAKITPSGLHYVIHTPGKGMLPKPGQKVRVNYTGMLLNGKVFDTSIEEVAKTHGKYHPQRTYQPFAFDLGRGRVIKGWDEGIALLKPGAKATLLVPSYLAYGERGAGNDIPPNSVLAFEVELVGIVGVTDIAKLKIKEKIIIDKYLAQKGIKNAQSTPSGLHYVIKKEGNGVKPKPGQKVRVNYTGMLLNGKVFDTSLADVAKKSGKYNPQRTYQPYAFTLGKKQVIRGWDEGIALLKPGTKATLLIPSYLAYGERGAGGDIPPNTVLLFEVELVGVE